MSTFGVRTTALRKALGLTQKEFGILGDLSQSNLSNAENDHTLPNIDFVVNIKLAFPEINLNWWVGDKGEMFDHDIEKKKLPSNMDPNIREFLEDLSAEVHNMAMTKKLIEISTKKKS